MKPGTQVLATLSLLTVTVVIASTAVAKQGFDLRGLKTGMISDEFVEVAEGMADERGVKDSLRVFVNQDGEEIPETVHNVEFSFRAEDDRSTFIAVPARKPMNETIHSLSRSVSYGSRLVADRPSLPVYTKTLEEKYGEPHNAENLRLSATQRTITLYFADGEMKAHCPDSSDKRIERKQGERPFRDCPTTLKVILQYWEQPFQPVKAASFEMVDHDIRQQDEDNFDPYWNQWMQDYMESRGAADEAPSL